MGPADARTNARVALLVALLAGAALPGCGASRQASPASVASAVGPSGSASNTSTSAAATTTAPVPPSRPPAPHPPYAVGLRVIRLVDSSRRIRLAGGRSGPRTLVTYVRYPALGRASGSDVRGGRPVLAGAPFPLVVFGHGFAVTPTPYDRLMRAWARAGYVVAAPVFPLESPTAPGGPDESDLVNQPHDMSVVISRLLAGSAAARGAFSGLVDRRSIAVAGQSDGGDTALTVAFQRHARDTRVRAAVILAGMEIPGLGGYVFGPGGPALLALQGTNDTINPPDSTYAFYAAASPPKYLVRLLGAPHLEPYTTEHPQLGIVERVTTAFLDLYLKHRQSAARRLRRDANVPGIAALQAVP